MDVGPFLQGHLNSLRQSTLFLGDVCRELSLNSELAGKLDDLALGLASPSTPTFQPVGPGEALEAISQARATVGLLSKVGYLPQQDGGPLGLGLGPFLDHVEMEIGKVLRKGLSSRVYGLYVIIDPEFTGGRDLVDVARGALKGGAKMLQLRDKLGEKGQSLPRARKIRELCAESGSLFIVNDHPDLAALVEADGLHVGHGDLPVAEARRILKPQQIIGRSNHLLEEVLESQAQGADHAALGAIYPTTTKATVSTRAPTGPEAIRKVKEVIDLPLVAIGGITENNVEPVVKAGADAICVTSAVGMAKDPEEASRRLVERVLRAGGKA